MTDTESQRTDADSLRLEEPYPGAEGGHGISDGGAESQQQLRSAKEFAEMIVDTVREGLLVLDLDLRVMAANESFYQTFGVVQDETEGRLLYDLGKGQWDMPKLRDLLEEILPEQKVLNDFEVEHTFEEIGRRVLLLNARQLDEHQLILLAVEDVTERKASERRRRDLFETMTQGVLFQAPPDGRLVDANPAAERLLGLSRDELLGRTVRDPRWRAVNPDGSPHAPEENPALIALRTGRPERHRVVGIFHPGREEIRWLEVDAIPLIREGEDAPYLVYTLFTDITERREAEQALTKTRDLLAMATEASRLGWGTWNLKTGEATWDARGREIMGIRSDDPKTARAWLDRIHPDDRAQVQAHVRACIVEQRNFDMEYRVLHSDGTVRYVHGTGAIQFAPDGTPIRGTGLVRDITKRKEAEGALRQLTKTLEERVDERTEQVRALTSKLTMVEQEERRRIAHVLHDDLQQRLYGIQMKLSFARQDVEAGTYEDLLAHLTEAEEWLDDTIDITRGLSVDLSPPILKSEGLADALLWLVTRMEEMHGLRVTLEAEESFRTPDEDMRVLLFQIVRELLFNVVKHADTEEVTVALRQRNGRVEIQVSDPGRGFEAAEAVGEKKGLGLFSIRERLALFDGTLAIVSAPGEGTQVTLTVPLPIS